MEVSETMYCTGCGIQLQTKDSNTPGFVPEQALTREPIVCHRCYRIKHYNEASTVALDPNDFMKILNHVSSTNSLVVNIVDIFDFEGSVITGMNRFAGSNPILLVVNKFDLLPRSVKPNRIVNWIRRRLKEYGIRAVDVILCSAKKNLGFDRLIEAVEQHRQGKDIYVVGATNVGKSTLINRLIQDYSNMERELTTSRYPGTTLDMVKIPLDDGHYIIDTPGIVNTSRMSELVSKQELQQIMPEKPLKPIVYQLNEGQTLFFGALARFDFIKGATQSFTCYVSNSVYIHRTKLEKADELYEQHRGEMLAPPTKERLDELPPLTKQTYQVKRGSQMEIAISGLGWITVNSDSGAQVAIHTPKGVKVTLRDSLI